MWGGPDLIALPDVAKDAIAKATDISLKTFAFPHQNLVSLQGCLSKEKWWNLHHFQKYHHAI